MIQQTTASVVVPQFTYISETANATTNAAASTTNIIQYVSLAGLALFLVKGSYVILIAVESMQMLYFNAYLLLTFPQNFFTVTKQLSVFNFNFLPDPFVFTNNYTSNQTVPAYK